MEQLLIQFSPQLAILTTAVIILLIRSFWQRANSELMLVLAVTGLAAAIWFSWQNWLVNLGTLAMPHGGVEHWNIGTILICLAAGISLISSYNYISARRLPWPEFLSLTLFSAFGGIVMATANNLISILIGLETLSISAYVLAGYANEERSAESAIKYFILGASASAIFVFGMAFYYGAAGTLELWNVGTLEPWNMKLFLLAVALIVVGFGFKIAVVPFQWWTPDVYQGSPLPVTTFFATAVKAAAFIAFFKIIGSVSATGVAAGFSPPLIPIISTLAVATMTFANLSALFQQDIKRMLAYSSIAHAGYILLAFLFINADAVLARSAMLFYLLAYIVMTAGAFAVLIYFNPPFLKGGLGGFEKTALSDFSGLGKKSPWLALAFTLFLVSLAGFPPTGGFFAKFYLFKSAVQHGYVAIVIIAVLNSLISVYYYMQPVVAMYFGHSELTNSRTHELTNFSVIGCILFCLIAVVFLGIFPSSILQILVR